MSDTERDQGTAKNAKIEDVEDLLRVVDDATDQVWIFRRQGDRMRFLESRPPEALRALGIRVSTQQRTGGGQYSARIRHRDGTFGRQCTFDMEGEPKPIPVETPAAAAAGGASTTPTSLPSFFDSPLFKMLATPVFTALGAGIASKLFAEPKTDPLMLEWIKQSRKSDGSIDALELNRLMLEAERRGEDRGRELGKLMARGERIPVVREGSGVVDAIREAVPLIKEISANAKANRETRERRAGDRRALPSSSSSKPVQNAPADIVPTWLRQFMPFKGMLLSAADSGTDAPAIAEIIAKNANNETWAAMIEAEAAGRLESDLYAAIPELRDTEPRQAFVAELLEDLRRDLAVEIPDPVDESGAKPPRAAKKSAKKKAAGR